MDYFHPDKSLEGLSWGSLGKQVKLEPQFLERKEDVGFNREMRLLIGDYLI